MTAYYIGTPCAAAGHTLRYKASGSCALCARQATKTWRKVNYERAKETKRKYYKANRLHIIGRVAKWRENNPEKTKQHSDKKYGRSFSAANQARAEHNGLCDICGTDRPGGRGSWHVDHVHDGSGDVRGLLCHKCNLGLGSLQDSEAVVEKALEYLRRPIRYKAKK